MSSEKNVFCLEMKRAVQCMLNLWAHRAYHHHHNSASCETQTVYFSRYAHYGVIPNYSSLSYPYILRYYDIIYYIILDMAKYDAPFSFQLFYLDDRQQIYNNNYNNGNSRRLREWALLFSFDTRRILYFNYRVINKSAWMQPMLNDDYDNGHNISYLFNNSNCSNRAWNGSLKIEWCNFGMDASQNWFSSHKQAALHPVVTIIASQLIGKLVLHAGYSIGRQCELFITVCMHAK